MYPAVSPAHSSEYGGDAARFVAVATQFTAGWLPDGSFTWCISRKARGGHGSGCCYEYHCSWARAAMQGLPSCCPRSLRWASGTMCSMSVAHLGQLERALQAVGLVGVGHVAEVDVGAVALVLLAEHHH